LIQVYFRDVGWRWERVLRLLLVLRHWGVGKSGDPCVISRGCALVRRRIIL
jgi:hypothetical protein